MKVFIKIFYVKGYIVIVSFLVVVVLWFWFVSYFEEVLVS